MREKRFAGAQIPAGRAPAGRPVTQRCRTDAITVKQRYETQDTRGGHTTFFVTGAFQSEEVEQDLLDNGFSFFFVKPFDENAWVSRAWKPPVPPAARSRYRRIVMS